MQKKYSIINPEQMENLGKTLFRAHPSGLVIYLSGELGAGKTTFVRGFLRAMGYHGNVKSPTYTLVEPYEFEGIALFHFDFYRLNSKEELEYAGVRDYFQENAFCLIEWPEKAFNKLPQSDLYIHIDIKESIRLVTIAAMTDRGNHALCSL